MPKNLRLNLKVLNDIGDKWKAQLGDKYFIMCEKEGTT